MLIFISPRHAPKIQFDVPRLKAAAIVQNISMNWEIMEAGKKSDELWTWLENIGKLYYRENGCVTQF